MSDLRRLFAPKSIAVFGSGWATKVIEECERFGFDGAVWPVHPTKAEIGGRRAYPSVQALPDAPDAAFVGVNRTATIDVVRALREKGAGGAVLFASGFAESGDAALNADLLEAAGGMPVLGPNCYGFVNALDGAVIWPDQQGCATVERGVAILSQSSNIAITLTMQRRGLPVGHVACIGNAAQTGGSEIASALLDDPRVTALGLYVEGIGDASAFAQMVAKARALGKGVAVLKAGRSSAGRAAAVSHTAALAGDGVVSSAFLRQCGAAEVSSLSELVETLKVLHAHGPLDAPRLISVSCSGGEAGLMADCIEDTDLSFPPISAASSASLRDLLGPLVAISNPFDYHTFIWGDAERMTEVFRTAMDGFDAGLFVLDPPRADRCSTASYDCAFAAMAAVRAETGKPLFAVATLPDSIDEATAARFDEIGIVPLLDMKTALSALAAASVPPVRPGWRPLPAFAEQTTHLLDEAEGKAVLAQAGIAVPRGASATTLAEIDTADLKPPYALKGLGIAHKSDAGAVRLNVVDLCNEAPMAGATGYLVEEMIEDGIVELLIGLRRDPVYGVSVTVGAGGVLTELLDDTVSMVAPVTREDVVSAVGTLRIQRQFDGYRGRLGADRSHLADVVVKLQALMRDDPALKEVEINPLIVTETGAVAADALIRRSQ